MCYNKTMENLSNLTKTEKLIKSARIIEETLLKILKECKADKSVIENQLQINEAVENFITKTGNIEFLSDEQYVAKLLEMCSLFKNAHISVNYSNFLYAKGKRFLSQHLFYFNGKIYLIQENKFFEVKNIGGWLPEKLCEEFDKFLAYETKERRNIQLSKMLNFVLPYNILGIDYSRIELLNGEMLSCNSSDIFINDYSFFPPFKSIDEKLYDSMIIDNHILKIEYFSCSENNEGDFSKFLEDVKEKYKKHPIDCYILDIRGNPGGNSELILPLLEFLKEKNLKGVTLTDNRVFSSGTFAAYYAKKMLSSILVGQKLGQGSARFGQSSGKIDLCDNLFIRYTEKFFDFRDVFKEEGPIKPDIEVPLAFEDICTKTDKTFDYARNYIENTF